MAAHARYLQASKAHQWMVCSAAPAMEDGLPDTSSSYAEEGTAAHELAATALSEGKDCVAYVGRIFNSIKVTADMCNDTQVYVDAIRRERDKYSEAALLVEQRVDFSSYLGLPAPKEGDDEDGFGTADAIILASSAVNNPGMPSVMEVHDFKFGYKRVLAENNPQMLLYCLGALNEHGLIDDYRTFKLFIHQPRIDHVDEWVCSYEELMAFAQHAKERAVVALGALAKKARDGTVDPKAFAPSESVCRWCKAKATCPALECEVIGEVFGDGVFDESGFVDYDALTEDNLPTDTAGMQMQSLNRKMGVIDLIEDWCKGIRAEVERQLFAGVEFTDYHLVEGRRGARAWKDTAVAEQAMKDFRIKSQLMYTRVLVSPTQAERNLAKTKPRQWQRLQPLIIRSEGKPSVAPKTDKRPAYQLVQLADFVDQDGLDLI